MKVTPLSLPEVLLIEPAVFGDARGYFLESYQAERYRAAGITLPFVQDNVSSSRRGVLRGLHYQNPNRQGKLVQVLQGCVFDVAVDVRSGSPTFGKWCSAELSSENHRQLWVPPGFAHGFAVTSDMALFVYKCTAAYDPGAERCIRWDDPTLGIAWPIAEPELSPKDAAAPLLRDVAATDLPR